MRLVAFILASIVLAAPAFAAPQAPPPAPEIQALLDAGLKARQSRQPEEAERLFLQAQEKARAGNDTRGLADAARQRGNLAAERTQFERALALHQEAYALYVALGDRRFQAGTLSNLGGVYRTIRRFPEALSHFEQALALFRELDDSYWQANTLIGMGQVYRLQGDGRRTVAVEEEALSLARKAKSVLLEASALTNLGNHYFELGETTRAFDYFQLALPLHRSLPPNRVNRTNIANVLTGLGSIGRRRGDAKATVEHLEAALAIYREENDVSHEASILGNLGGLYGTMGDLARARAQYRQAQQLARAASDPLTEATALLGYASAAQDAGQIPEALEASQRALTLFQGVRARRREAEALQAIGNLYLAANQPDLAQQYLERALPIARETQDKEQTVNILIALAGGIWRDAPARARRLLDEALGLARAAEDRRQEALILKRLGWIWSRLGRGRDAEAAFGQAQRLLREIGDIRREGSALSDWGQVALERRQFALAQRRFEQALGRFRIAPQRDAEARVRFRLGMCQQAQGRLAAAETSYRQAVGLVERQYEALGGLSRARLGLEEDWAEAYQTYLALLLRPGREADAFSLVQRMKARTLLDRLGAVRLLPMGRMTAAERQEERALRRRCDLLNANWMEAERQGAPTRVREETRTALAQAERELVAFTELLYVRYPELARRRAARPAALAEVAARLAPETALLEYVVVEGRPLCFVVTRDRAGRPTLSVHRLAATMDELTERASNLREACARPERRYQATAKDLYRMLLEPVASSIAGKRRLLICPDGGLWEVPFAVLTDAAGRPLLQRAELVFAYSATGALAAGGGTPPSERLPARVLVAAISDFAGDRRFAGPDESGPGRPIAQPDRPIAQPDRDILAPRGRRLANLEGARREGALLKALFPGATVLAEAAATETAVLAAAPGARLLHFATHGFANDAAPLLSALVMAPSVGADEADGFLTARELLETDLSACQLCVLSACETGRGRIRSGEGLMGLTWALAASGCRAQMVSQWSVSDASTADLMRRFYAGLSRGRPSAAALRAAALGLRADGAHAHPYYWAPFVLFGDGR